jgi:hypothetical protein
VVGSVERSEGAKRLDCAGPSRRFGFRAQTASYTRPPSGEGEKRRFKRTQSKRWHELRMLLVGFPARVGGRRALAANGEFAQVRRSTVL